MAETDKAADVEVVLEKMREAGINGAVIRNDGVTIHSNIAMNDVSSNMLASVSNVSDALAKKAGDKQKNLEIVFGDLIYVVVPVGNYIFCGAIKDREQKTTVLEFAKKSEKYLM